MPFLILSVLLQVAFVIHIVKTGRDTTWIWIVVMLPLAGSLAYLVLEVLPDLTLTRSGRAAGRKMDSVINPNKDFNRAAQNFSISGTVENSLRLAEECMEKGMYQDAKTLYEQCRVGLHKDEPQVLVGLASAEFMQGNYVEARSILDELIEDNPSYKNQNAHLLYARIVDALGDTAAARHEYEVLHDYFSGPEASFHYGVFLKSQGELAAANRVFDSILEKAKNSSKHYASLHKETLARVRAEIAKL